jgi:hypothetical protein
MIEYREGDRIELIEMPNDPNPIKPGERGNVREVRELGEEFAPNTAEVHVDWDSGRKLLMLLPTDKARIIERCVPGGTLRLVE